MDIKQTPPEEYAAMLRAQGVPEDQIQERVAHDMLRALLAQFREMGVPPGFENFAADAEKVLAEDAVRRTLR